MEDSVLLEELDKRFRSSRDEVVNSIQKDFDGLRTEVGGVRKDLEGLRLEVGGVRKDLDLLRETTSKEFALLRESIEVQIGALIKVIDTKPDLNMVAKLAWVIVGSVVAGATLAFAVARIFLIP